MAKLRSVSTAFWSDPFIEELTPSEKLLYIYFITNEKTNMLGIYEVSIKKICFETGLTKEIVLKAFETFRLSGKIKYDSNFIILVNFIKHQNYNPNMKKAAIECYNNLPNHLKINDLSIEGLNPFEAFETLSNHLGMVRKVEYEYEYEKEDEKISSILKFDLENCINIFLEKTEHNWNIDYAKKEAEKFYNFYSMKNWMVGKNKMKSLPHAIAGWISRNENPILIKTSKTKEEENAEKLRYFKEQGF
jgi:hypothetical protein